MSCGGKKIVVRPDQSWVYCEQPGIREARRAGGWWLLPPAGPALASLPFVPAEPHAWQQAGTARHLLHLGAHGVRGEQALQV